MDEKYYIEVGCQQKCHAEARVCGDVFLSRRIKEEGRIIAVLADGMGHGIKANLLATLASTLALKLTEEHKTIQKLSEIIMTTLPFDSVKNMNFSTFTIIDISVEGEVTILEYENPKTIILRGTRPLETVWNCIMLEGVKNAGKEVLTTTFTAQKEDRIIFGSDGITQSGLGSDKYPVGWGQDHFEQMVLEAVRDEHNVSATRLASKVIERANHNDGFHPRDDMSCCVVYFREPRKLMVCTGPPQDERNDAEFAKTLTDFDGKKIICGATTADIISREWKQPITDSQQINDPELPPTSSMNGVELITEGILTLSKVNELLKAWNQNTRLGKGPADEIVKLFLECDEIHFLAGTKINEAHQDPTLPIDLELRRTVVHRLARVLEEKFLKEVSMKFW